MMMFFFLSGLQMLSRYEALFSRSTFSTWSVCLLWVRTTSWRSNRVRNKRCWWWDCGFNTASDDSACDFQVAGKLVLRLTLWRWTGCCRLFACSVEIPKRVKVKFPSLENICCNVCICSVACCFGSIFFDRIRGAGIHFYFCSKGLAPIKAE